MPALSRALCMIGSDVEQFSCPHCGGHDRERHLLLYMRHADIFDRVRNASIMHFAPEVKLSSRIKHAKPLRYIPCDLHPRSEDMQRVDMTAMHQGDASLDLLIANHVLEHIPDEPKALREIHRVLKPGGLAILQTPFASHLQHTWEDPGIVQKQARLEAFGQEDHVRLYGLDIFARFEQSGLQARIHAHEELLPDIDPTYHGVNALEPFMCFEKPR
ncbi:methyltransferase domain-containing protein [Oleiagrimonas citrea]|uniref:Methyltransferase domain-containing protein n=1 Tax=Oleiagrimonas citrea TaxID=1665687 RepID=A0A846ZQ91_9GAMM|nr:class I SAM-dependent methyltransferase [Oleiagrimonas citrea]NKZ39659.1 methyltransferase domain-containing protein [Oleiagrimonas citrea]